MNQLTTREERAKQREQKRRRNKFIVFLCVTILIAVCVLVLLTVILKKVTPEEIGTTNFYTETTISDAEDLQNAYTAASGVLSDYILSQPDLESKVRSELGEAYNSNIVVFISVSDGAEAAHVVCGVGESLQGAWNAANTAAAQAVVEKQCETKYIKADIVNRIERIASSSLNDAVSEQAGIYGEYFRSGVAFDPMFNAALTEAEINSNELIDYDNTLNLVLERVNLYLGRRGLQPLSEIPENIYLFSCRGFMKDGEGCSELGYERDKTYGRRVIDVVNKTVVENSAGSVANYMLDSIGADGRFVYGSYPVIGLEIETYSAEYHALALSAASKYALRLDSAGLSAEKLASAASWLRGQIKEKDGDLSFILDPISNTVTAGAQSRAISAFCDYMLVSGDQNYAAYAEKLGAGLISMIGENGEVTDGLLSDFAPDPDQERRPSNDAVAALALTNLYALTAKQEYFDAAKKISTMMAQQDYAQYADPVVSETMDAITIYAKDTAFYDLALKNYTANANALKTRQISDPGFTRLMTASFNVYKRMQSEQLTSDAFRALKYDELINTCVERANDLLNGYTYPEFAVYFKAPDSYIGSFFVRQDGFRIRIDDMASFVLAYLGYAEDYTSINADVFEGQEREAASRLAAQSTEPQSESAAG